MKKRDLTDRVKERIKFNTEVLRLSTVGILTIGGGTISIIQQEVLTLENGFIVISGFIIAIILSIFLFKALRIINRKIR